MYIDPHVHMVSRTTDDYARMAVAGCVAITEPAFWAGYDRSSAQGFHDYFRQLTDSEPRRAAAYGIRHHAWICINPKEAEDHGFAREVMGLIPEFLQRPNVLGIGEIGLNRNSRTELAVFEEHLELAAKFDTLVLVHTPHRDKKLGTIRTMDVLEDVGIDPGKVIIDHNNEETVKTVLDRGYWAAFTIYPHTKLGNERMVEILREYGAERIIVDSAADWGISDALAVPKTAALMKERGVTLERIEQVTYKNPLAAYGQSGQISERDWEGSEGIDPTALFEGNTLLRGGMDVTTAMSQYLMIE